MLGPHKSSVARLKEKLGIDQRPKKRVACCPIESPHPLRLCRSQPQAGHFPVFALYPPKYVIERLVVCHWRGSVA
jgi:hypothetical protein